MHPYRKLRALYRTIQRRVRQIDALSADACAFFHPGQTHAEAWETHRT